MFGAVYSRFLNNLLKSSKVYPGLGLRNGIKHYVEYRAGKFSDFLSLEEILNALPIFSVFDGFYRRVLLLCRDNNRLDVLESLFKNSKFGSRSLFCDTIRHGRKIMKSHWGLLACLAFRKSSRSRMELLSKISKPKDIQNFDYLKTGENNLQFAESHKETILNLFSQLYKILKHVDESAEVEKKEKPVDPLQKLGILVLENRPTEDELAFVYFLTKFELRGAGLEDVFCLFLEFVDYLNRRIQSKDCDYGHLKLIVKTISKRYMKEILRYCVSYRPELSLTCEEVVKEPDDTFNMLISNKSKDVLAKTGLENFLKFLNVDYEEPKSDEDLIYGIIKDSESTFIYDFQKEKIVWGNNKEEMDLRNFKGNCLDKITFCHFIIFSKSHDVERVIKDNIDSIKKNYLNKINLDTVHSFVSLDLPYFKQNPPQPFDTQALEQGKIIKQLELENSLLKEDNENLSRELLEHSDLLKDHFTLRVYSHDKDLECSNLKKRVELECQLQSKLNIQNLNLTHSVICQNQSKLPKRSLTFPAYFNKGDNTPDSSPFPVNDVDLDHNFLVSKLRSQVQDLKSENMALKDMLNRTEKVYKKEFERLGTELEWVQKSNEQLQKYCYLLSSLDSHVSQSEVSDEIGRILNINH
eukprot:XP_763965.1 hypothetical protein [Theileria parva strain Muguga]